MAELPFLDLKRQLIMPSALALIPEEVARENTSIAVANTEDGKLIVVTDEPVCGKLKEQLEFILNREIVLFWSYHDAVAKAIDDLYPATS